MIKNPSPFLISQKKKKNSANIQRDQNYRQNPQSKPSAVQIFPRNPRDVTRLSLHPRSLAYKAFRGRWNVFTIWKASITRGTSFDGQLSTRPNPISHRGRGSWRKIRWRLLKRWISCPRIDSMPRRRIVKTFVINWHWLGRCNEPLQTRIKIKDRAVVMAGR